jgi:Ca2+-binding EF-hand superfamily protein
LFQIPQPPKRRPPAAAKASGASSTARPSKLAKEHNLTAQEEAEIREAFSLFSEPMEGEKEGVIPIGDVRRAMMYVQYIPSLTTSTYLTFSFPPNFHGHFIPRLTQANLPAP